MIHGVTIDNRNTLAEFGLCLLADVKIGEPEPKTSYITIPEADGFMDATGWLTGGVVRYEMREISFALWPVYDIIAGTRRTATEYHAAMIRQRIAEFIHGQEHKLWLPDDPAHYFRGRFRIGEKGGYNDVRIPVSMTAEPWRYKNLPTEIRITEDGPVNFSNETRRAVPTFTATLGGTTVTFGSVSHEIEIGENTFPDIILEPGQNILSFSDVSGTITATYQEAVL